MDKDFNKWIGPVQLAIYIAVLLLTCGVAYASITARVQAAENRLAEIKSDHDLLVRVCEQVNEVARDVAELKVDVKELKNEFVTHATAKK